MSNVASYMSKLFSGVLDISDEFGNNLTASYDTSSTLSSSIIDNNKKPEIEEEVSEEKKLLEEVKGFLAVYLSQLLDDPDE